MSQDKVSLREAELKFVAKLAFFLGTITDTKDVDTTDVEAWAYRDGWNEAILQTMQYLDSLRASPEATSDSE